jgi:hypothetical protein
VKEPSCAIDFHPNDAGQALIRRGKTDAEGQGRVAYLSRETVKWLKVWLGHSGITEGGISSSDRSTDDPKSASSGPAVTGAGVAVRSSLSPPLGGKWRVVHSHVAGYQRLKAVVSRRR